MICYHGSDTIVDIPRILNPKRPLDFGGGFYITTNKEQALKELKTEKLCDQILFHTDKSLQYLKYINTEVISNG